jgi:hypothetical protein
MAYGLTNKASPAVLFLGSLQAFAMEEIKDNDATLLENDRPIAIFNQPVRFDDRKGFKF